MSTEAPALPTRRRITISGIVQGVGFRPLAWQLARRLGLTGWVLNEAAGVQLELQGGIDQLEAFAAALRQALPTCARIDAWEQQQIPAIADEPGFAIRESRLDLAGAAVLAADIAVCDDCLAEMRDPGNRRFGYPLISCARCGPRFTIAARMPFDRQRTSMVAFPMCSTCAAEYQNPADRRFHAQTNACAECGPTVWLTGSDDPPDCWQRPRSVAPTAATFEQFFAAIDHGEIVAVKGIGGFHLVCDATNSEAVDRLRRRKGRGPKPLAIMVADLRMAASYVELGADENQWLSSPQRPILLLPGRDTGWAERLSISDGGRAGSGQDSPPFALGDVAPGNDCLGIMLPYSPLHYLLIRDRPLVVTSGNVSDEPIVRTNAEARQRLSRLADRFLLHDREIQIGCDDSVVRLMAGRAIPIRRSRGLVPLPVTIPEMLPPVLAVGGDQKCSFCLVVGRQAYLSQHIGDLSHLEAVDALSRGVAHFERLLGAEPKLVAADRHPDYLSSRWAAQWAAGRSLPFLRVQHHHAHVLSLMAEQTGYWGQPMLGCCFDGTGFGEDGTIWGGEFLRVDRRGYQRLAHLEPFPLPGGEACIGHPWRSAVALLWLHRIALDPRLAIRGQVNENSFRWLIRQLETGVHCVRTSSMGRLFDAVASLCGLGSQAHYEAQLAIELEVTARRGMRAPDFKSVSASGQALSTPELPAFELRSLQGNYRFELVFENDCLRVSSGQLIRDLCRDVLAGVPVPRIAADFHLAVCQMMVQVAVRLRQSTGINRIGLTGGVFQNALLVELAAEGLTESGFEVLVHQQVPPNDGGLALGQAIGAAWTVVGSVA